MKKIKKRQIPFLIKIKNTSDEMVRDVNVIEPLFEALNSNAIQYGSVTEMEYKELIQEVSELDENRFYEIGLVHVQTSTILDEPNKNVFQKYTIDAPYSEVFTKVPELVENQVRQDCTIMKSNFILSKSTRITLEHLMPNSDITIRLYPKSEFPFKNLKSK